MMNETLIVEGMKCNGCVKKVQNNLENMGVTGNVDLSSGEVKVQFDQTAVSIDHIMDSLKELGYSVNTK
jgi:copper chaperone